VNDLVEAAEAAKAIPERVTLAPPERGSRDARS